LPGVFEPLWNDSVEARPGRGEQIEEHLRGAAGVDADLAVCVGSDGDSVGDLDAHPIVDVRGVGLPAGAGVRRGETLTRWTNDGDVHDNSISRCRCPRYRED
jgi:hypothetical protein